MAIGVDKAGSPRHFLQMITVRWWNASAYYGVITARALHHLGYHATVVSSPYYPVISRAQEIGLPVFTRVKMEAWVPWQIWRNLKQLHHFVYQENIRILNAHRPEDHAHAALLQYFYRLPVPVVRTVTDVRPPKRHRLNRWLHQKLTDFFIFSTYASVDRYNAIWPFFKEGENFLVHPGAVDTQFFKPDIVNSELRRQWKVEENEVIFGLIARLSPVKGHRVFLQAAARISRLLPQVRFLISGEAVEIQHQELQSLAAELGISSRLILLEKWPDVRQLIHAVDVGIVASLDSEVVCRIGMEMMAMQKPIIASGVNVLKELIDNGVNGLLVPPGDATALAEAMLKLARQPAEILRMGKTARQKIVQKCSIEAFGELVIQAYGKARENFKRKIT